MIEIQKINDEIQELRDDCFKWGDIAESCTERTVEWTYSRTWRINTT